MEKKEQILSIMTDLENKVIDKYQATELILVLFDINVSLPDYKLKFCEHCIQMTNHINDICQKCKRNEH